MANYADGLTDLPLSVLEDFARRQNKIACFLGVKPMTSYHVVSTGGDGVVTDLRSTALSSGRINGGFFILRPEVFDYMEEGEELVEQPFRRLINKRELASYSHDGFWACMDTFKEKQHLDELHQKEIAPWEVWNKSADTGLGAHATGEIRQTAEASLSGSALR